MKAKRERPLGLDMGFDEALARFARTDPKEVEALAKKRGSPKQPPGIDEKPLEAADADAN